MERGIEHRPGGIFSLCRLIERFGEAIEYDLAMTGRSLDDLGHTFSWRELWVLIMRWQKTPGFATCDAVQGREHWDITAQLLANVYDVLEHANWQRIGKRSAPKPKRLPRPWEKSKARKLGSDPIPVSKFNDWWNSKVRPRDGRRRRARNSMDPVSPHS